jgi:hypothetical protein
MSIEPGQGQVQASSLHLGNTLILLPSKYETYSQLPGYLSSDTKQMPINNNCLANQTISTNMIIPGMSLELAKAPVQHVKTTLPPSIYFPGEAEIRYYLKATVNLPSFLKQNPRAVCPFDKLIL